MRRRPSASCGASGGDSQPVPQRHVGRLRQNDKNSEKYGVIGIHRPSTACDTFFSPPQRSDFTLVSSALARSWQQGWLAAWCAIALVCAIDVSTLALMPIQHRVTEWAGRAVTPPPAPEVVLIAIDDVSLTSHGPWPWPREMHARLIDRLTEASAGTVAYTTPWPGAEPREALNQINRLAQAVAADPELADHAQLTGWVHQSQVLLDGDSRLAQSLAQNQRTVLAIGPASAAGGGWPLAELVNAGAAIGHLSFTTDEDGVTRALPLIEQRGNHQLQALPSAAVALWQQRTSRRTTTDQGRGAANVTGQVRPLWVAEQETRWIQRWSAADLLAGRLPPGGLKDRLVVVGLHSDDPAAGYHLTPVGSMTTSEAVAQAAGALIHHHVYTKPRWATAAAWSTVLLIAVYFLVVLPRLRPASGWTVTLLFSMALLTATFLGMVSLQVELPTVQPLVALWIGHAAMHATRKPRQSDRNNVVQGKHALTTAAAVKTAATTQAAPLIDEAIPHGGTRPLQGPVVGNYQLQCEIGRGAMGRVYRAIQRPTGRIVAVKTLALAREFEGFALQDAQQRFQREALTASRLQHPDIVRILETGDHHGQVWIAMELLHGHDLIRHTSDGHLLPVPTVLEICARIASALAHAHSHGVVHRDIKPANVMVELADHDPSQLGVKVMDFGIARVTDAARTRTGLVLGSPSYMSPEHLAGRAVDGRSDLYSLGVLMFQMLTGQLPFQGSSVAELMHAVANLPAPDVRALRPRLPEAVSNIVALALEKRTELRYSDGHQLAADLRSVAALWRQPAPLIRHEPDPMNRWSSTTV